MRNLKKVLCLALVLTMVLAVVSGAAYTTYVDDGDITSVNSEYVIAAQLLQDLGIVIGKEENGEYKYDPKGDFDRASMARVLYVLHSAFGEQNPYNQGDIFQDLYCSFKDIDGVWAASYIKYGFAHGYLSGKNATTYDPYAPVTAQEMATALLAVLGYEKTDLAKNYPNNVVKYAYTKDHNMFTTGLSINEGATAGGHHIVALYGTSFKGSKLLCPDYEAELELKLSQALNREQAFYMLYKAITQFPVVTKVEGNITLDDGKLVASVYNYTKGSSYLEEHFGKKLVKGTYAGVVVASADKGLAGIAGKSSKDFTILTDNNNTRDFVDFGYEATIARTQGTSFYAFNLNPIDWNTKLYQYVDFATYTWDDGETYYAADYQFDYNKGAFTTVSDFNGQTVTLQKDVKIEADGAKLKVDGTSYALYNGAYLSVNGADYEIKNVANLAAELADANGLKASDALTVYLVNGKIFAIDEAELLCGEVKVNKDGDQVWFKDVDTTKYVNTIGAKDGDIVRAYVTKDGDKLVLNGYVLEKIAKQDITVKTDAKGNVTYFMEDGTELVAGASDWHFDATTGNYGVNNDTTSAYGVNLGNLDYLKVPVNTAYFDIYMDGGYVYAAKAVDKYSYKDLTCTAVACTYNTASGKYNYTISYKDADDVVYTETKELNKADRTTANFSGRQAKIDAKDNSYTIITLG